MADVFTVSSKEFSDIVRGKRFIVMVAVLLLVMAASLASVYLTEVQGAGGSFGRIGLPQGVLGAAGSSLVTMMTYFAPIMGIALGFDVISGEREKGTLKVTLSQPVYRDTVINGKFVAALMAISLATLIAFLAEVGVSVVALGVTPTAEDIVRLSVFLLITILFAMTYYGISAFLSTVTKRTAQSIIIAVVLWALFTFVISIVANLVATSVVPYNFSFQPGQNRQNMSAQERQALMAGQSERAAITGTINSITPNYHFTQVAGYILKVYSGFGGFGVGIEVGGPGQVVRSVSLMESLGSAWPNILVLTLTTIFMFFASYMVFTRQEVR